MTQEEIPIIKAYKDLKWCFQDDKVMQYDMYGFAATGAFFIFLFRLVTFPLWMLYTIYNKIRVGYYEFKIRRILKHNYERSRKRN